MMMMMMITCTDICLYGTNLTYVLKCAFEDIKIN